MQGKPEMGQGKGQRGEQKSKRAIKQATGLAAENRPCSERGRRWAHWTVDGDCDRDYSVSVSVSGWINEAGSDCLLVSVVPSLFN